MRQWRVYGVRRWSKVRGMCTQDVGEQPHGVYLAGSGEEVLYYGKVFARRPLVGLCAADVY